MAITFLKQPLKFFNVNEPAIFEFKSDADLGVNPTDLVADLQLKSLYTSRSYTIKNILPNYGTGVFRIDVSDYLKALILDNFEYVFNKPNKQYSIENYQIGVSVHPENASDIFGDEYVFDSGYIFDTTFIFAEQSPSDNASGDFYPIEGISQVSEFVKVQKDLTKLNILSPKYVEFAPDFVNTISIFMGVLDPDPGTVTVDGVTVQFPAVTGVATVQLTNQQITKMYLPTLITTSLNNPAIPVYGIAYRGDYCENIVQIRYYTSYGGYAYFYSPKDAVTANRGKTDTINNNFYNQQDGYSPARQREVDYKEQMNLTGVKQLQLVETFLELLRSPKVEVFLDRGFTECTITGTMTRRKFDFEYSLSVDIANDNQMTL